MMCTVDSMASTNSVNVVVYHIVSKDICKKDAKKFKM